MRIEIKTYVNRIQYFNQLCSDLFTVPWRPIIQLWSYSASISSHAVLEISLSSQGLFSVSYSDTSLHFHFPLIWGNQNRQSYANQVEHVFKTMGIFFFTTISLLITMKLLRRILTNDFNRTISCPCKLKYNHFLSPSSPPFPFPSSHYPFSLLYSSFPFIPSGSPWSWGSARREGLTGRRLPRTKGNNTCCTRKSALSCMVMNYKF